MSNGFFRVAAAVPAVTVADPAANADSITAMIAEMERQHVRLGVFPEMCVTGYTCADLFHNETLLDAAEAALRKIAEATRGMKVRAIIGGPLRLGGTLYNAAYSVHDGHCEPVATKTYIPNYNEFYEKRWWASGATCAAEESLPLLMDIGGVKVAAEICEDLWAPVPPSTRLALAGAEVIVNLSASDDQTGKYDYLLSLIANQSAHCYCGYVYASAGFGESTTDVVFDGKAVIAENGRILARNPRWQTTPQLVVRDIDIAAIRRDRMHNTTFHDCAAINAATALRTEPHRPGDTLADITPEELMRDVDPRPFVPSDNTEIDRRAEEITGIQAMGLARRLQATHSRTLVVGISGGLDSTLALLIAVKAFDILGLDRKGIIGVTMPGLGTTDRTHNNALLLMESLGVTSREVSIVPAVMQHFADIGQDPAVHDVTFENSQARERTQILMDIANKEGGFVLGTGDLSELALGWATYNGDQMSMYGVNASVPKTLVKYLVNWFAMRTSNETTRTALLDIVDTPISPELTPADENGDIAQKTEDLVGPYELHDFFLYYTLRYGFTPRRIYDLARKAFAIPGTYDEATIKHWMRTFFRRFFNQQFKRSCMPDGPKVGSVCLSPRGDWRMPSDASSAAFLREVDSL